MFEGCADDASVVMVCDPPADLLLQWAADDAARDATLLPALLEDEAPVPVLWDTLSRLAAFDALLDDDPHPADPAADRIGDAERVDRLRAWARVAAYAQAMMLEQVAALHRSRDTSPTGTPEDDVPYAEFLPVEVAQALRLGPRSAENLVADAVTLTHRLPATLAALRRGVVDQPTARAVAEEAALVRDPDIVRTLEATALRHARTTSGSARSVRLFTRRQALRLDPAAAARRVEVALGDVGVEKGGLVDGVGDLTATLTAVDRAAVWTSLTDHAKALRGLPGEKRSMAQLRAAALVDLTTRPWLFAHPETGTVAVDPTRDREGRPLRLHRCSCGGRAQHGPWRVDVVVNLSSLLGVDDDPALLVGQGLVPADTARALAADGVWRRLVTDPVSGGVLERSPTRYRPGTALADHVTARDQHCQMPGCRRPAGSCDIDHRTSFRSGGPTTVDNLWALCRRHHRCKHSPGWSMRRQADGGASVSTPTGHTYAAPPPTPWDD